MRLGTLQFSSGERTRPRVLIAAPRRNALEGKVRDGETPSPAGEARALPGFFRRPGWLSRYHSFATVSHCEESEHDPDSGRCDRDRAPIDQPIGTVIKGEATVGARRNLDQRDQIAKRRYGEVASIDSCAIAWEKRTGERN